MKKKVLTILLAAAMILGLTACGASYDKAAEAQSVNHMTNGMSSAEIASDAGFGEMDMYAEEEYEGEEPQNMPASNSTVLDNSAYYDSRKLIRTVNLDVETKEFDQMLVSLESQVAALGGYIEDMYTFNGSSYSYRSSARNASMTARIPKQQLNTFLDTVSSIGNVVSRSENVEDVTLSYVDTESRKEALTVEQERLMELLEMAESLEDMLIIEERLTNVRYQLDNMESQLRTYDNKVDFATVYLNINEVKELTPVVEETTGERIVNGFMDSLKDVGEGFVDFFVWFVVHIPYLVIWAAVIAAIVVGIRLWIRHRRKKRAKKLAQMQGQPVQAQGSVQEGQPK